MSKAPSPLLGYNHNVRHKNKAFHIQTEDSGVRYGHIITHLFADGGRILKSVKTSYAEHLSNPKMADVVREMMKEQHKAMIIALRDGAFDVMLDAGADASQQTKALSADATQKLAALPVMTPLPVDVPPMAAARLPTMPSAPAVDPETERTPAPHLTLDIDALERAAAAAEASAPAFKPSSDLPPPPTNLFRERSAFGQYRTVPTPPPGAPRPASIVPPPRAPSVAPPPPRTSAPAPRRYAQTRPASIFGQNRPQQGKTVFGEDLISDKSLDEVILSYLADDLEPPPPKK
jgi:hypothetical protein